MGNISTQTNLKIQVLDRGTRFEDQLVCKIEIVYSISSGSCGLESFLCQTQLLLCYVDLWLSLGFDNKLVLKWHFGDF